jgi:hypothetical protein
VQRHGIGQQVQRSPSGSTPHDRVSIPQICSSHSPTLDRPRQSALRYPAVLSNRASTYSVRRQPAPIHAPLRSRTTSAIAPPTISHSARGTQIPITHAAPPTYPFPRFPPLEVCGRRPRCARHHLHGAGIRKPSQKRKLPIVKFLLKDGRCSHRVSSPARDWEAVLCAIIDPPVTARHCFKLPLSTRMIWSGASRYRTRAIRLADLV